MTAITSMLVLAALGAGQLLPPPRDGDIRVAYYELQNVTDIWLTLEPRTLKGERAPLVTFTCRFPGKRQTAPTREVEVQAFAGQFWAPRPELWFELDGGNRIDLSVQPSVSSIGADAIDSWTARLPIEVMRRLAGAQRIRGNALRFPFELSAAQIQAIRAWLERITPQG